VTTVYRAQVVGDRRPPDLDLRTVEEIPPVLHEQAQAEAYEEDANKIVSAMIESLPGGTIDRVLILLLHHRASLLRVSYATE